MSSSEVISHEDARELLPWLVNESLADEERDLVNQHARNCVICRRELEELERLHESIATVGDASPVPAPDLRRINARIDAMMAKEHRGRLLISRLREIVGSPLRLAFAMQTALLVVLGAALFWPQAEQAEFTTLTVPEQLPDGQYIRVVFDPNLDSSEWSGLLDGMSLTIVDGPSDRGVATLRIAASASGTNPDTVITNLLSNPGVLFAVPVRIEQQ